MAYITQAVSLTAVAALNGGDCGKGCAPGTRATFAAVSTAVSGGAPYLYVNAHDGAHDQWDALALTGWTHDTTDVFGFQDFIMVVNGEETLPLARSVDGGKSVTFLPGNTDMATHPPLAGDMLTPDKQVLVGKDGYIYLSTDHGDTWQTVDAGVASSGEDLTQVRICRQNPAVLYASGANGAIAASYNGGYAWVPLTAPSGDDITALEVLHENEILVGTDALELHHSLDGGESWIKQADLPSLPTAGSIVALFCCACGAVEKHGVCYAVPADSSIAAAHRIYRNAGWGSGQWEIETGCASLPAEPADLAAAHNNLALVVGGNGTTTGFVGLLS